MNIAGLLKLSQFDDRHGSGGTQKLPGGQKVAVFTVATKETRSGNWVTADRWVRLLNSAGHRVQLIHSIQQVERCDADVLVALHARRSAPAVFRFQKKFPKRGVVVALTGTDIYGDIAAHKKRKSKTAIRSLNSCDRIILLQPLMAKHLTASWKRKSTVVMMDVIRKADTVQCCSLVEKRTLKACVVGHLRYEKDPFRAAMAVRKLPDGINIRVTQLGNALSDSFRERANREHVNNPNWNWRGAVTAREVARTMLASDILINPSRSEGAPNVIFEAMSLGLPMLVSKIDGHVGVLGNRYPGYFAVGDTRQLTDLLCRCATDADFYLRLVRSIDSFAKNYSPRQELASLQAAIASVAD